MTDQESQRARKLSLAGYVIGFRRPGTKRWVSLDTAWRAEMGESCVECGTRCHKLCKHCKRPVCADCMGWHSVSPLKGGRKEPKP